MSANSFAFVKDLKPYKTQWKIQVKVLHTWKSFTHSNGETFEMILSDVKGTKIHGSIRKDFVTKYEKELKDYEWYFIERFSVANSFGKAKPTSHAYKINFLKNTIVSPSETVSDSHFLSLVKFDDILSGQLNFTICVDVVGQVVNVGAMETYEVQNKQKKKVDLELRDTNDVRLQCTLWGYFAEQVLKACEKANDKMVILLLRFAKCSFYKDVMSVSNYYDASQLRINPPYSELEDFKLTLPADGLILTMLESRPRYQIVSTSDIDNLEFPNRSIVDVLNSTEVGKVKIVCHIFAVDTDWAWYYFACNKCNKKVQKVVEDGEKHKLVKPKFQCDTCMDIVTNVCGRYKLHVKVMDNTSETKCLLFDSMANEIIGQNVSTLLNGSFDEIEDPECLPDPIKNLIGKTFQFLLSVEKDNLFYGNDTYRVVKVLSKNVSLLEEPVDVDSDIVTNSENMNSADQSIPMLTYSQENSSTTTPSSKRSTDSMEESGDQSSSTKKLCLEDCKITEVRMSGVNVKQEIIKDEKKE